MSSHAVPYLCPFCGDEDLRPAAPRGWECRACARVFAVELVGIAPREVSR